VKLSTALAAALGLLLLLTACQAPAGTSPADPTPAVEPVGPAGETWPTLAALPETGVAATVNGQEIPMALYAAQLQAALKSYGQQPGVDPADGEAQAALRQQVLAWLIDQTLIDQAAEREGIVVDEEQVTAAFERIRNENPEGFAEWLSENGFTEETFHAQTRSDLLGVAMRELVTREVGGKVEQVHLRQIVVPSRSEAEALLEQLRGGSATFEALAQAHSTDEAGRGNGGDLGFLPREMLPESVAQAAFAMQPGEISAPVQSRFGWHVVQVVERDPAREVPPEMLATMRQEVFMRWLENERARAQIERYVVEGGQ
jgi:parvulin-like peptidyl-prolyl isomerase